jgi:hypothetical protein
MTDVDKLAAEIVHDKPLNYRERAEKAEAELALYKTALDTANGLLIVFVKAVAEILKP